MEHSVFIQFVLIWVIITGLFQECCSVILFSQLGEKKKLSIDKTYIEGMQILHS